jgi:hypothetical protein
MSAPPTHQIARFSIGHSPPPQCRIATDKNCSSIHHREAQRAVSLAQPSSARIVQASTTAKHSALFPWRNPAPQELFKHPPPRSTARCFPGATQLRKNCSSIHHHEAQRAVSLAQPSSTRIVQASTTAKHSARTVSTHAGINHRRSSEHQASRAVRNCRPVDSSCCRRIHCRHERCQS